MAPEADKLSHKQRKAIAALLTEPTIKAAAEKAGIGERTLHTWLDDPGFRLALNAAEGDAIDAAVRRLVGLFGGAVETLDTLRKSDKTTDSVRLRASVAILEHLFRARELRDLEVRLAALEELIHEKKP
jgi:hypothetical protein